MKYPSTSSHLELGIGNDNIKKGSKVIDIRLQITHSKLDLS